MELTLPTPFSTSFPKIIRGPKPINLGLCSLDSNPLLADVKLQGGKRTLTVASSLPETAASVAIAATVVGAAATLLSRRNKASEAEEIPLRTCEDCGGSGLCSECKGEGFVLKKLSDENAERARLAAKNMATRFTAALPKKWSYCSKCSSARSCTTCGGSGTLNS
ncbi:uncharacterized protein LOC111020449 [Momordica charantia]|uniref:Uncharacterized protein LOC111020449 n=1 Tax=Momordica charantia TaxID=3673 RepID=A0A6J1DHB6_MOMCH|nr:uncharacterized protein LOC111020449 [Momordica charantia]